MKRRDVVHPQLPGPVVVHHGAAVDFNHPLLPRAVADQKRIGAMPLGSVKDAVESSAGLDNVVVNEKLTGLPEVERRGSAAPRTTR